MADEEQQRGSTKRQIARLIGNASVPIFVLAPDDRILFANDALAQWARVDEESLIGLHCSNRMRADDSPEMAVAALLALPPNTDRTLGQLYPVSSPGTAGDWICVAVPLDDSEQPALLCAIKRDRGDHQSMLSGVHRAQLKRVLALSSSDTAHVSDVWFLCGSSPEVLRARKQLQAAIQSKLHFHVVGPAASATLAIAKAIYHRRYGVAPASGLSRSPLVVFDCQRMDREILRGMLDCVAGPSNLPAKTAGPPCILLHQLDALSESLVEPLCEWIAESSAPLAATSSKMDLLAVHPRHGAWGELVAMLDTHLVCVPPLSQRRMDIEALVAAWLERMAKPNDDGTTLRWSREFMDAMIAYSWPGDIEEFDGAMRQATERCHGQLLTDRELPASLRTFPSHIRRPEPPPKIELDAVLEQVERQLMQQAMKQFPRNRTAAAAHLGISRARFLRRIQQLGLAPSDTTPPIDAEESMFEEWVDDSSDQASDSL